MVTIRKAVEADLDRILELGAQFGHLMFYQKDREIMKKLLPDITVAVAMSDASCSMGINGYYHAIEITNVVQYRDYADPYSSFNAKMGMLKYYKCLDQAILSEVLASIACDQKVLVIFQGGCHREVFQPLIQNYIDQNYDLILVYCSKTSGKAKGYEELGFTFDSEEEYTFWNPHKCGVSTYRLGRWTKPTRLYKDED